MERKETYTVEEIVEIIDKHMKLNEMLAMVDKLKGNDESSLAHIGAMTGLKMLKMEIEGEREYQFCGE